MSERITVPVPLGKRRNSFPRFTKEQRKRRRASRERERLQTGALLNFALIATTTTTTKRGCGKRAEKEETTVGLSIEERIQGLVYLLSPALRVLSLVEWVVREKLELSGKKLRDLYDGQTGRQTSRPSAELLLKCRIRTPVCGVYDTVRT